MSRGDVYQQAEWVLLDAHSLLLERQLSLSADVRDVRAIATACERLSALISRVSLAVTDNLLQLQLKVCLACGIQYDYCSLMVCNQCFDAVG